MPSEPMALQPTIPAKPKRAAKLYHVHLVPRPGIDDDDIKAKMDLCLDWYKYGAESWLVKSNISIASLKDRFKPLVEPEGFLLIFEVQASSYKGWMPKSVWVWIKDALAPKRSQSSKD